MSDDLISRKDLITEMEINIGNIYNPDIIKGMKFAIELIKSRPTAFNKKKVIGELKSAIGDIHYTEDGSFNGRCIEDFEFIQAKTALEIVEKGGIG